ncbi:MAG TPA: carbohydrate ABC transporter permease [Mycobacteriales bacterium]|nr:carbohydrate ABC transporter permease [Mycobacteriales bacterium]
MSRSGVEMAVTESRPGGWRRLIGRQSSFGVVNGIILLIIGLLCVYPFLYVLSVSLSDGNEVSAGRVFVWPRDINIETYRYVFSDSSLGIVRGLINSIIYTVVGTTVAVLLTFMTGYVLSRKYLPGRYVIMMLFVVSWIFEAGLIPSYIVNSKLGLVNNPLVMILPTAISTFLLIITRSFLEGIPDELEESASLDGANAFQVMWRIYFPLSTPVLATIGIFYAVQTWNSFMTPLIYLQDKKLQPIQLVLYQLLINKDSNSTTLQDLVIHGHHVIPRNIEAATMMFAAVPILLAYPFAQRYFTKGITVGAIKG